MTKMKNRPCIYDFPGVKLYGKPWWGDTGKASVPGAQESRFCNRHSWVHKTIRRALFHGLDSPGKEQFHFRMPVGFRRQIVVYAASAGF